MTLLIAVGDALADAELLASAQNLAKAAGWEARVLHARGPGRSELGSADVDGLEILDLEGEPSALIAAVGAEAGLDAVALGMRPRGGRKSSSGLGDVAEALFGRLAAPLMLVRPGMRPLAGLRRLIVPLEGSPSASAAMAHADDAFCTRGREIVMLHVVTSSPTAESGSLPAPRMVDQEHYEWSAWQEEFCMRFSQCPEGGRHRVCVRVGEPAPTIAEEARSNGAELIVLSWNGTFADGHGAVVKELIATAPCPLLVIPSEPQRG